MYLYNIIKLSINYYLYIYFSSIFFQLFLFFEIILLFTFQKIFKLKIKIFSILKKYKFIKFLYFYIIKHKYFLN